MKDIVIDTYLSIKVPSTTVRKPYAFELFGYDFMIDDDFRVWLIEANTNPSLFAPNPHMKKLVSKMIDDLMSHIVDPIYPS
jgi:hypothetical protein